MKSLKWSLRSTLHTAVTDESDDAYQRKKGGPRLHSSIHKQATALRELAEWGMRGLQGSFPCLKDHLLYEERGERRIILEMIVLLYNFRASTVEMNQIQSTFMPHLERSANKFVFNF
jgi:hypothetical protein